MKHLLPYNGTLYYLYSVHILERAQNLNEPQQSKLSYVYLARIADMNHPGTSEVLLRAKL